MATSQELPFDTETELFETKTPEHKKDAQHLSEGINIEPKAPIKIKYCSPLDASSNLEFTRKTYAMKSFANIRGHQKSFSLHQIHQNSRSQAYRVPNNRPGQQTEKDNSQRATEIMKEISDNQHEIPLYKIWPGNNRFYFDGRLMTGPETDKYPNMAAWVFVIGINVLFFGAALPFLADQLASLLPFLSSYLCISTVTFFLLTSFTDPGIIPRKCVWELNGAIPKPYCDLSRKEHSGVGIFQRKMAENSLEFCTICQIYRPPKAVHCKYIIGMFSPIQFSRHCGNCVEVFGGHLRIFNNCIGKRNYRFFVGLIASMVLLTVFYVICFVVLLVQSFRDDIGPGAGNSTGNSSEFFTRSHLEQVLLIRLRISSLALLL